MAAYKFYTWENNTFPHLYKKIIDRKEIEKTINKLVRHFKTPPVMVSFRGRDHGRGTYYYVNYLWIVDKYSITCPGKKHNKDSIWCEGKIVICSKSRLIVVLHEFAHHLADTKYSCRQKHNKNFKKEALKVYRYYSKKLLFE